jgi:t-SNARE complex subunit (syntaxin)
MKQRHAKTKKGLRRQIRLELPSLTTDQVEELLRRVDCHQFDSWARSANGSARLQAILGALQDTDDSLETIDRALDDGDIAEAQRLLALGRASLMEHMEELKGLL